MMKIISGAILILVIAFLHGCVEEPPHMNHPVSDVEKTNIVRRDLGVREIKSEWKFYIHQFGEDTWKDGDFQCKKVKLNEELDEILWEQDYYYTGTTWADHDGTHWEHVTVTYEYFEKEFYVAYSGPNSTLEALLKGLNGGNYGYKTDANEKTLEIADKILKALSLTRL